MSLAATVSGLSLGQSLAVLGVAEAAELALIHSQIGQRNVEEIKRAVTCSAYWSDFVELARVGAVPTNWLPGVLGNVVLGWARAEAGV